MESTLLDPAPLRLVPGTLPPRPPRSARTFLLGTVLRLTPGDRRIALALHAAQSAARSDDATAAGADAGDARPKSLDEIVGMERRGGWSHVFKVLKSEGLVHEQTLGHVVARWAQRSDHETIAMLDSRVALRAAPSPGPSRID
jgi:hypothetical protein